MTSDRRYRILCVAGARPNMMKVAPLIRAFAREKSFDPRFLHTGQHFDYAMSDGFIKELGLPAPDAFLGVGAGGGSQSAQLGQLFVALDSAIDQIAPDLVVVVGDVNSTLAASLVASRKRIAVAHVEAGLRSFDRSMPEEINRIVVDQVADILYATEQDAIDNLKREGIPDERIRFVGNVMIDSLLDILPRVGPFDEMVAATGASAHWLARARVEGHAFLTMHRPSNVDQAHTLRDLLETILELAEVIPVLFAVHPRTQKSIDVNGLHALIEHRDLHTTGALSYEQTVGAVSTARIVVTDSGGLQEETTALGVPCLTIRETTERPVTVHEGTNVVVGTNRARVLSAAKQVLQTGTTSKKIPALWDGRAADRIAVDIGEWFAARSGRPS